MKEKTRINIEEVIALKKRLREINEIIIEDAIFIDENGNVVKISEEKIEFWRMTGLNIGDFVDMELNPASRNIAVVLRLDDAKEKCITNCCRNSAGTLWESLWKFEDGKFMQKTCASGLFNDWHVFEYEELAYEKMQEELEIITKVREED